MFHQASILHTLLPHDPDDDNDAVLEVRAGKCHAWLFKECALSVGPVTGAGGKEAALFTAEVFHMYQNYSAYRQWEFEVLTVDTSDGGGYRVSLLQCKEL